MIPEFSVQSLGDQGGSVIFRTADDGYLPFTKD